MPTLEPSPVVDTNLKAADLDQHVLSLYPLGEVRRCLLHARGVNDTYKVELRNGALFYLRIYCHGWRTKSQIEEEVAVICHLDERGAVLAS